VARRGWVATTVRPSKMTTCEARSEHPHSSADEVGRDGLARNRIGLRDGFTSGTCRRLLVVGPHSQDMHEVAIRENFVDKPMLDVDASRIAARQVTDNLFVPWRCAERVLGEHVEEPLGPLLQARRCEPFRILLCLARKDQRPATHQSSSAAAASVPSARA